MHLREMMESAYKEMIIHYLQDQSEQALYQGQNFSRKSIENNISPEEIIILHKNVVEQLKLESSDQMVHTFDILLEVMMGYGLAYRELQSLRLKQYELRTEMEIAANVQQTLLGTNIPVVKGLDIGAISVPAKHMNGDYYHFVQDENQNVNVAIADVIGKGIPAALCMSMIKYAMDSLPENRNNPKMVLENLNRVVEQNVDLSMFISMFYGVYSLVDHTFRYASAGHEPGIYYCGETGQFTDLKAKGLLLGIDKKTTYREYVKKIARGDMIILMSDGVTECRTEKGFIEKETLIDYLKQMIHLPSQELVNRIYKEFEKLQHFQMRDDFTLIVMRREV